MWFLIKGTFWCTMTLVALSFFSAPSSDETAEGPRLEVGDAIAAATGAVQYIGALCTEKPEVCEKGKETLTVIGHKARDGAMVAYQLLGEQLGEPGETPAIDPAITESVGALARGSVEILKPAVEHLSGETASAEPVTLVPQEAGIVTGTVVPGPRPDTTPRQLPRPYQPPKL